jgi:type IV secretion system protein VirB8
MLKNKANKIASQGEVKHVKNWYADRYLSIIVQRNFLFLFAAASSIGILVALIIIKNLYEQKSIDPYLIEVDKQSNIITLVEQKTQEEYTAQEAIKEYFFVKYLNAREGFNKSTFDQDMNLIRVLSSKDVYELFMQNADTKRNEIMAIGRNAYATNKIGSISYITPNRVEVRFSKDIISTDDSKQVTKYYVLTIGFNFLNLELSLEDRRLNPLGFQVISYILQEEKRFNNS